MQRVCGETDGTRTSSRSFAFPLGSGNSDRVIKPASSAGSDQLSCQRRVVAPPTSVDGSWTTVTAASCSSECGTSRRPLRMPASSDADPRKLLDSLLQLHASPLPGERQFAAGQTLSVPLRIDTSVIRG